MCALKRTRVTSLPRIFERCTLKEKKKKSEAIIFYAGLALKQGISRISFCFRPIFKKKRALYLGLCIRSWIWPARKAVDFAAEVEKVVAY